MPPAQWPLQNERAVIQVVWSLSSGGQGLVRYLIADTGAGSRQSVFQLILAEHDCQRGGGILLGHAPLGGAYAGSFPLYLVDIRISQLNYHEPVPVVGVPQVPRGFDGIAGFKFLNRFHYGNFGNPDSFGLDLLHQP
jgi:hypothetical protein